MAQLIYLAGRPLPSHAMCACGECRGPALRADQYGSWRCQCCAAPPTHKRMEKCPLCGRTNAPFEEHHRFGQLVHKVLGVEHETEKICLNCHAEITAYFLPMYKLQRLLFGKIPEKNIWFKIAAALCALVAEISYDAFFAEDPYLARYIRDNIKVILDELMNYANAQARQ